MILKTLIQAAAGIGTQFLTNKAEKAQAKHGREIKKISGEIDADIASTQGMASSLKDEYLTILLSAPLVVIFYAAVWGDPEQIEQVKVAFEAMNTLPEWFTWAFLGCVTASFGLRSLSNLKK